MFIIGKRKGPKQCLGNGQAGARCGAEGPARGWVPALPLTVGWPWEVRVKAEPEGLPEGGHFRDQGCPVWAGVGPSGYTYFLSTRVIYVLCRKYRKCK